MDSAGRYVPAGVISSAKNYMEKQITAAQPNGIWRHAGYSEQGHPQEIYDDFHPPLLHFSVG